MYMFTVYLSVPLITPPVSVVPVIDGQQISLNISINVSTICKGEYPNSITVNILNTNDTVISNSIISTQINDQLMVVTGSTSSILLLDNIDTFIVNVTLSNDEGTFNDISSFTFGFLGLVTNIDSSIDNCSTINITWTAPTVDDRVSILYYKLRIYDITLVCTGEAPENVTVIIRCGTGDLLSATYVVKFANMSVNITRSVSGIPIYEQCNISIVVSNEAGSSEPSILVFDTYPTNTNVTTTVQTSSTATPITTSHNKIIDTG
ncbi:PREDICTED: uncharacterized protein LOC109586248 [Amphimedon queenslandica]|uniref:Fibronectin type-III domain-containing protein n=1 Tax=Amphimedon queenslandica TaxID=400682 RepID=A0AAN0JMH5_AMPQE|nr:PREDICTED: uncharacterized protein LOC109586248 [Amphimedon queenslandica]|eukprot:XP_019857982.1 PREDICTED: uncharacterized protein LOC109586248 [Amphimedon queenslandica]